LKDKADCKEISSGGNFGIILCWKERDYFKEGDQVRTGSKSNIKLGFPDGSIVRIWPNSLFRIDKIAEEKNSLYLSRGSL